MYNPELRTNTDLDSLDIDARSLADTVPHKMWYSGACGGVLFLNKRYFAFTGLTQKQVSGMGWRQAIHPEDLPLLMHLPPLAEAVQEGYEWTFEYRIRRHDGEYRWHLGRVVPLLDANGAIHRWVGTATEIHSEKEAAHKKRRFLREVLFSVTEGRLRLCDAADDLCAPLSVLPFGGTSIVLTGKTLSVFRHRVLAACAEAGLSSERTGDLIMAAGEAAMNAVVHAECGEGCVYISRKNGGMVQVRVVDKGDGIAEDSLHRATLEKGFSSAGTFGHGFPLMLRLSDCVYLLTGNGGTTVVIEQHSASPEPATLQFIWNK